MAATTTPSISWLLPKLNAELSEVEFIESDHFSWSPATRVVSYDPNATDAVWQLLHEAGHATSDHATYTRDIELLGYEVDAWTAAQSLAHKLDVIIPDDVIESHIDTYRDWLHARSQCTACAQTGVQTSTDTYRCLHCPTTWRVNDSRQCGLRRYQTT